MKATLILLVRERENRREVLLGIKKRGVGAGLWNAPGGKFEPEDPSIEFRAITECEEEICVTPHEDSMTKRAIIHFFKKGKPYYDVVVFTATEWSGEPQETEEMGKPNWFSCQSLPLSQMLEGDVVWMPTVLNTADLIVGEIYYDGNMKLIDHRLEKVDSLD